jgi:tetratricopeptide (TPR) repeat protein
VVVRPVRPQSEPTKLEGKLAATPDALADVIYLPTAPPPVPDNGIGELARQLGRQALWLAAHEEFGLRARDAALGESAPDGLPDDRFVWTGEWSQKSERDKGWGCPVFAGVKNKQQVWAGREAMSVLSIGPLPGRSVEAAERFSRETFSKCLVAARFAPRPNKHSAAPVPAAIDGLLRPMRETAQFAAVRALHDEVRRNGESDALVGALSRGYATLGLLTEFHWSSAPYVFKARGLLYAQRLVARSPKSALARWHRAYAAALAGLHNLALDDLGVAATLAQADPAAKPPAWAEPIGAYLHFDLPRLAALREQSDTPLARLLDCLVRLEPNTPLASIRAGRELLAADPECYRVYDALYRFGGVGTMHRITRTGPDTFSEHLIQRVAEQPGLPKAVTGLLAKDRPKEAAVYAAMRQSGKSAEDRGSPSWAALGSLLQETRFTQAWYRLYFMGFQWSVSTAETARAMLPPLEGHPRRGLVEAFTTDPRQNPTAFRDKLKAVPMDHADMRAIDYLRCLTRVDPAAGDAWWKSAAGRNQGTYYGMAQYLHATGSVADGWRLRLVSPHAPLAIGVMIVANKGPDAVPAEQLPELEKRYAGDAFVQKMLGKRYQNDGRPKDAIRCWERRVELSPDTQAFLDLAAAYDAQGDEENSRKTLEASLKQEDMGLNHAWARVTLARRYMAKKEYAQAEPYALAAAECYAGWALLCAAECEEKLGKWDEANKIYRAMAERYETGAFDWYLGCRNTGHMDRAAAERAVRAALPGTGERIPAEWAYQAGRFFLLAGEPKEALVQFNRNYEANKRLVRKADGGNSPTSALLLALVADMIGDKAARDRALGETDRMPGNEVHIKALAASMRKWLAAGGAPDEAAVQAAVTTPAASQRADCEFYVGWFLANRGQTDRAVKLWKRCLESEAGTNWLRTHARAFVEEQEKKAE